MISWIISLLLLSFIHAMLKQLRGINIYELKELEYLCSFDEGADFPAKARSSRAGRLPAATPTSPPRSDPGEPRGFWRGPSGRGGRGLRCRRRPPLSPRWPGESRKPAPQPRNRSPAAARHAHSWPSPWDWRRLHEIGNAEHSKVSDIVL